ncbi:MAG: restriction endonuclease subunit S [Endomicrobium sp.]|jgi:hypothetical protein|nr:restriction endonuclease subunit S [Endomicrobium sp.]
MNTSKWKEFEIGILFDVAGSPAVSIEELNSIYGCRDYPYITRTEKNNGLSGFYNCKNNSSSVLTIETTLSGLCFYHDYEFSTGDHIAVLKPKGFVLNKYTALFIKTVWRKNAYKYSYGRPAAIKNIKTTYLLLPAKKNHPDWQYMENYIKSLESCVKFESIKTTISTKPDKLNMKEWKEFKFTDKRLWERITHGQRLIESDRAAGEIPYYSASQNNNGMTDRISNPLFTEENCIIYSTFGTAFWVEKEFTASDEIYAFYNSKLNKYNALFITTIMKQNQYKFKFGRKAFWNKFENESIKLPVDKDNNPDWQYMENYIKSLPYSDKI